MNQTLKITANTEPLMLFKELINFLNFPLDLSKLPEKFFRVEIDDRATTTGELLVTFYPSDLLMNRLAALSASDW